MSFIMNLKNSSKKPPPDFFFFLLCWILAELSEAHGSILGDGLVVGFVPLIGGVVEPGVIDPPVGATEVVGELIGAHGGAPTPPTQ